MPPFTLTDAQRQTLRAVCDTLVPALPHPDDPHGFWGRSASDLGIAEAVVTVVGRQSPAQQAEFRRLLWVLGSPLAAMHPRGPFRPVPRLSSGEREALLRRWATHPLAAGRRGFQALKRLTTFLFYALVDDETGTNPNWPAIGYPGPLRPPPDVPRPISPLVVARGEETLLCDVVVVGSGAGGGVVAGELAMAGQDVVVVEKGPYVAEAGFTQREAEMMATLYEAGGTLATHDLGVAVLAGSCLGGGTTINWTGAFRTPDDVLEEWARAHLLPHLLTPAYQRSFAAVERVTHVDTDESPCNPQNRALWAGTRARGGHARPIPRNVHDCDPQTCGYCGFGCQRGAKQSTLKSYLLLAHDAGARFLVETEVERVLVEDGRAVGVLATQRLPSGEPRPVTIRAARVVVAAGAIHTPALLRRSGLTHPHIGRHLYLHPTVAVAGFYEQRIDPWWGVMMAVVNDEWARLDGAYGVRLETAPAHPGLIALALPWESGAQHKAMMARARHLANIVVLVRDRDGGHVSLDRRGRPVLHYRLSAYDRAHLWRGIQEASRVHAAAGAETVLLPHGTLRLHLTRDGDGALERLLAGIEAWGWAPNQFPLFSAHQMGTCRMGGDAERHPLTPESETREVRELFVTDASAFPAASGANPMLSIQAMAHYAAQGILARA